MHASWMWRSALLRRKVATVAVALCAVPVVLSVPAGAQAAVGPLVAQPAVSVSPLASGEVEEVLESVPLRDLPAARLSETLAQLPGLSALPEGSLRAGLQNVIEQLAGNGDTLGQLLGSGELASKLRSQLLSLLTLEELNDLPALLEGKSLSSVLEGALGSVGASQLLAKLLGSAGEPGEPEQLIEEVLGASNPESLRTLLGSTLAGEPFTTGTVEEVAQSAGTTAEGLASEFGTTSSQLPAAAMALTAPLSDGKTLGVLDGLDGLDLGLLGPAQEGPAGGGSGGSGAGGPGGSGGGASGGNDSGSAGGAGGSGGAGGGPSTPGGVTLVVDEPAAQGSTAHGGAAATAAKVAILKRMVRRGVVTLVVRVPAAGRLTIAGKGVRSVSRQTDKAERLTVRVTLTKAAAASLRRHHRSARLTLDARFASVGGPASTASTAVTLG